MNLRYQVDEGGLTLVELLVTLMVVSLIIISVPASFRSGTQVWEKTGRHSEALQNVLVGVEEMTREIRQAKYVTGVSGEDDDAVYIQFSNRDSVATMYQYESGYLRYGSSDLAGPVDSLKFICYDEDDEPTTTPDRIRAVQLQLVVSDEGGIDPIPLSSRVYIRDLILAGYDSDDDDDDGDFLPGGGVGPFVFFGSGGLQIKNNATIDGNIGANADVSLGNGATINGTIMHLSGGVLDEQNPDQIVYEDEVAGAFYVLPQPDTVFAAGSEEIDKDSTLPPGSYGDVNLGSNNTLDLSAGVYYFRNITAKNKLTLNIKLDSGDGNIRIFVGSKENPQDGKVVIGNEFTVNIDGGDASNVYIETNYRSVLAEPDDFAVKMGQNIVWQGMIYAPYGHVQIVDGEIAGSIICGGYLEIHNSSGAEYVPNYAAPDYWPPPE